MDNTSVSPEKDSTTSSGPQSTSEQAPSLQEALAEEKRLAAEAASKSTAMNAEAPQTASRMTEETAQPEKIPQAGDRAGTSRQPSGSAEPDGRLSMGEENSAGTSPSPSNGSEGGNGSLFHNVVFKALAQAVPVSFLLLLAALCWMPFFKGDLFCPQEVTNMGLLASLGAYPLLPNTGGSVAMPIFPWLAKLLADIPLPHGMATPLTSFLCSFLALLGVWGLTRCSRLGSMTALAAGLLLFCTPAFLALSQFFGPVSLACGFALLSLGLLGHAWMQEKDVPGMFVGHLLAVAAGLTGGFYFGLIPVLSAFVFCAWRGSFRRARNMDALLGFGLYVFLFALWAGLTVIFTKGIAPADVLRSLVKLPDFSNSSWWRPFAVYIGGSLPLLLILLCASWGRILRNLGKDVLASRRESGSALLWIALCISLALSLISPHLFDIFLATAITAVLAGRALLRLCTRGTKFFFILVSVLLVLCGFTVLALAWPSLQHFVLRVLGLQLSEQLTNAFAELSTLNLVTTITLVALPIFCAAAILHVTWRSRTAAAPLLVTTLFVLLMAQPVGLLLAPAMAGMPALKLSPVATTAPAPAQTKPASSTPPTVTPEPSTNDSGQPSGTSQDLKSAEQPNAPVSGQPETTPAKPDEQVSPQVTPSTKEPSQAETADTPATSRDKETEQQAPAQQATPDAPASDSQTTPGNQPAVQAPPSTNSNSDKPGDPAGSTPEAPTSL